MASSRAATVSTNKKIDMLGIYPGCGLKTGGKIGQTIEEHFMSKLKSIGMVSLGCPNRVGELNYLTL